MTPEPSTSLAPHRPLAVPLAADVDVKSMFDRIAHRYDAANRVMSVGVDILWRRKAMKPLLAGLRATGDVPPRILDLGAGTLDGALTITARHPGARVVAADFAKAMLRVGRNKLGSTARRIDTHGADGHRLPYRAGVFDAAFSAFCVRNLLHVDVAMAELRRVVKPGGTVVILEFFRPRRPRLFFDKIYNAHVLPWLGWAVSGDRDAYRYLPASIDRFLSLTDFEQRLRAVGFAEVKGRDLFPGGVASMVVAR